MFCNSFTAFSFIGQNYHISALKWLPTAEDPQQEFSIIIELIGIKLPAVGTTRVINKLSVVSLPSAEGTR
jgi:hypothetical protein